MKKALVFMIALFGLNALAHANCDNRVGEAYQIKNGKIKKVNAKILECSITFSEVMGQVTFPNGVEFISHYEQDKGSYERLNNQKVIEVKAPPKLEKDFYRCVTNKALQRKKEAYCFKIL